MVGSLRDREVACSTSDGHASNFETYVLRTVSSQSSHHPQDVLLAQFSLYVHEGGLKPDSFHFIFSRNFSVATARKTIALAEGAYATGMTCPPLMRVDAKNVQIYTALFALRTFAIKCE